MILDAPKQATHNEQRITNNDLVIIGSGIAGLYAALLAAPYGRVLVVTKGALEESNTRYAQGGIAAALGPQDSPELHLRDTIAAGDGLCDREAVAILTREAPGCILDLLSQGVPFDRDGDDLAWTLEAAHSRARVLHAGGDATGASIERTLAAAVRAAGVTVLENALCTRLLGDGDRVSGVELLLADGALAAVHVPAVLLATGGAGRLFARTTNPEVATGDGLAAAYRAGAELTDLEFFQFHPTALALPGSNESFLISEAVRGEGGILRDVTGHAFMEAYHPDRELAPRDVVARANHRQMTATGAANVWLDVTHLPAELIERRFPTIVRFCRDRGIDPVREPIPVAPAAHYLMGGVRTDDRGRTSLQGFYACGEVACTGVHGANRLASNSLLEGLVFARRAVGAIVEGDFAASRPARSLGLQPVDAPRDRTSVRHLDAAPQDGHRGEALVASNGQHRRAKARGYGEDRGQDRPGQSESTGEVQQLRALMWQHAGLIRSETSLLAARSALAAIPAEDVPMTREAHEAANLRLLAELLIASALTREESRGAHYRSDFPARDAAWLRHVVATNQGVRLGEPVAPGRETHAGRR